MTGYQFTVSDWRPYSKNTLQGFLSLTLPSGMVIHNVTLHRKNGSTWVSLPARQYQKGDGTPSYAPLIEFATNEARSKFQRAALDAVKAAGITI